MTGNKLQETSISDVDSDIYFGKAGLVADRNIIRVIKPSVIVWTTAMSSITRNG
ncbi:MAG: hypothetical protein QXD77_00995 [Candidatus Aenigmatarchaeota archaeon]